MDQVLWIIKTSQNGVGDFREGMTNVHVKRKEWTAVFDLVKKVDQIIREDCLRTLNEIYERCVEVSRAILQDVISNRWKRRKLCAR